MLRVTPETRWHRRTHNQRPWRSGRRRRLRGSVGPTGHIRGGRARATLTTSGADAFGVQAGQFARAGAIAAVDQVAEAVSLASASK